MLKMWDDAKSKEGKSSFWRVVVKKRTYTSFGAGSRLVLSLCEKEIRRKKKCEGRKGVKEADVQSTFSGGNEGAFATVSGKGKETVKFGEVRIRGGGGNGMDETLGGARQIILGSHG